MKDSRKNTESYDKDRNGYIDKDGHRYIDEACGLIEFIDSSPSCFHAIDSIRREFAGYEELKESSHWKLEPGKGYYVIRNSSSIIAFRIPEAFSSTSGGGFLVSAAHSDSPAFKVKQNGEITVDKQYVKLNVEKYGGMIMSSWLDRPLSVAGRVFVRDNGKVMERLVNIDRDLLIIPNVAIHMNRDINEDCKYDMRKDMQPLLGMADADITAYTDNETACTKSCTETRVNTKGVLNGLIADVLNIAPESILSTDLFLYPRVKGTILGAGNELIASRALDDLQCAYAIVQGFIKSGKPDVTDSTDSANAENAGNIVNAGDIENAKDTVNTLDTENTGCGVMIPVCCVFDSEEVGSGTRQGADSGFLRDVLYRITGALVRTSGKESDEAGFRNTGEGVADVNEVFMRLLADSFMISADNAHAVHPNHPEYADVNERPYLNGGVVVKFNAAQKYTTDAYSYARLKEVARRADVPLQIYSNRPDIAGGSTLGNLAVRHVPIPCVDIGLPQLAMHSCYETAGAYDTGYMIDLISEFYR